jgi:hypothetical protein
MSARMIIELPAGQRVLFGGRSPETGLAEVGVAEDIPRVAGDKGPYKNF